MYRALVYSLLLLAPLSAWGQDAPTEVTRTEKALAQSVDLKTHNPRANRVLNEALHQPGYWNDASKTDYANQLYDITQLKPYQGGYIPMIGGESDEDIPHDVVAHIIYVKQTHLPKYMEGARAVTTLGTGHDPTLGLDYRDTYYFLDFGIFYSTYATRMYQHHDPQLMRTVLWFESLTPEMTGEGVWNEYQKTIKKTDASVDKRWAFNSVIPFGEVFGMFIVTPGEVHTSRVTFISKLSFGEEAGWIAKWGSQLPGVIKAGLKSGYNACVQIAKNEKKQRGS